MFYGLVGPGLDACAINHVDRERRFSAGSSRFQAGPDPSALRQNAPGKCYWLYNPARFSPRVKGSTRSSVIRPCFNHHS